MKPRLGHIDLNAKKVFNTRLFIFGFHTKLETMTFHQTFVLLTSKTFFFHNITQFSKFYSFSKLFSIFLQFPERNNNAKVFRLVHLHSLAINFLQNL
jgi:hypothetical protein